MHYVVNLCSLKLTYIICAKIAEYSRKIIDNKLKIKLFQIVPFMETLCFYRRNTLFPQKKHFVSPYGTRRKQYQEPRPKWAKKVSIIVNDVV